MSSVLTTKSFDTPDTALDKLRYRAQQQVRSSIAREIARDIVVSDELVQAKLTMDAAVRAYQNALRDTIREQYVKF